MNAPVQDNDIDLGFNTEPPPSQRSHRHRMASPPPAAGGRMTTPSQGDWVLMVIQNRAFQVVVICALFATILWTHISISEVNRWFLLGDLYLASGMDLTYIEFTKPGDWQQEVYRMYEMLYGRHFCVFNMDWSPLRYAFILAYCVLLTVALVKVAYHRDPMPLVKVTVSISIVQCLLSMLAVLNGYTSPPGGNLVGEVILLIGAKLGATAVWGVWITLLVCAVLILNLLWGWKLTHWLEDWVMTTVLQKKNYLDKVCSVGKGLIAKVRGGESNTGGGQVQVSGSVKIPVLTDVVSPMQSASVKIPHQFVQKQAVQAATVKRNLPAVSRPMDKPVVLTSKKPISVPPPVAIPTEAVDVGSDNGLFSVKHLAFVFNTLNLAVRNIRVEDGPLIRRILFEPVNLGVGGEVPFRKATVAIANKLKVDPNEVAFSMGANWYAYEFMKPEHERRVLTFDGLFEQVKKGQHVTEPKTQFPILLGTDITGMPRLFCLYTLKHLLMCGVTGTGKSMTLHAMLVWTVLRSIQQQQPLVLNFIDVNGATAMKWTALKGAIVGEVANSTEEAIMLLHTLKEELNRRKQALVENQVQNISLIENGKRFPLIILVIEEIASLFVDKATKPAIVTLTTELITTGRKYGILIWGVGTKVLKGDIGKDLFEQFTKVSLRQDSPRDATHFGGVGSEEFFAHKLAPQGDMLIRLPSRQIIRIHSPVFAVDMNQNERRLSAYINRLVAICQQKRIQYAKPFSQA